MSEVGNISIDEARELVADRSLWPRVRDFLWDFAPQIHPSWLEDLDDLEHPDNPGHLDRQAFRELVGGLASSARVKRFVLDSLGVEPCFHAFPGDDGSRLLLLDGATLESVARWLGALAFVETLRRVTSGATVRALKAGLSGVYPEVFGYTMYFGKSVPPADAEPQDLPAAVVGEGCALLLSALSGLPPSLVSRLKFKLPKGLCASAPRREIRLSTVLKLLKLKFPEAHSLCCS